VKALGLNLADRGLTQVSMNLTDYRVTSPARVVAEIRKLAAAEGVEVCGSELIGFSPADALVRSAAEALNIEGFDPGQILDNRL
jgi:glutamate formiminotransferase